MSSFWARLRRPFAWLLAIATILYLVVLLFAWLGVSFSGPAGPTQVVYPAEATRNFLSVSGGVMRTYVVFVIQFITLPFIIVAQFAFLFWFLARGTTYTIYPGEYDVTFDDVRGQDHIVKSTKEVMRIFQGYKDFRKLGGHPPRGVLFEGPPGTGKTLLAKAIAGETGVPFMYASGAGFANMFMGIPQMKVRSTFKKARRYSDRWGGCVVFIDELDSIGGSRMAGAGISMNGVAASNGGPVGDLMRRYVMPGGMGGGTNLVNALLTELDGVDKPPKVQRFFRRMLKLPPARVNRHNILVVGATNLAATLDAALLRPGRFDRKVHVGVPAREGRRDIIGYYLAKVNHEPVDLDRIAKITNGWSPAALRNLVNEALINALQDGRQALNFDDLWKAFLTDRAGIAESVEYNVKTKQKIALHEAGHAMCEHFLSPSSSVSIITIRKRDRALGIQFGVADEETFGRTKTEMLANIKIFFGGMVAEEVWFGESSTGPSSDLQGATAIALAMITHFGLGEDNLLSYGLLEGRPTSDDDIAMALRNPEIAQEANRILHACKEEVRQLLLEKRVAMEAVRDALVEKDEISGDEFRDILFRVGATTERPKSLRSVPIAPSWVGGPPQNGGYGMPMPGWGWPAPPAGNGAPGYPHGYPPAPGGGGGHGGHGGNGGNGGHGGGGGPSGWGSRGQSDAHDNYLDGTIGR